MQIVRFRIEGKTRYGVLDGPVVVECTGTPFGPFRRGRRRYPLRQVVVLPPVLPGTIVVVAPSRPGAEGADETHMFLKPVGALVGPDDPIATPPSCARLACEPGMAAVIRRRCRNVATARVREHVLGWTVLNDVLARDVGERDGDWTRARAFDTFGPVGPCIATDLDPNTAIVETWVNGSLRAAACVKELGITVEDAVARVSEVMTLLPGDVVVTDVPGDSGPVVPGDRVEIRVEGVGGLKNTVVRL